MNLHLLNTGSEPGVKTSYTRPHIRPFLLPFSVAAVNMNVGRTETKEQKGELMILKALVFIHPCCN